MTVMAGDLGFFLSDLEGELEESDRGLLEEAASGLEESDFLEEKNLPLKTMVDDGDYCGGVEALVAVAAWC